MTKSDFVQLYEGVVKPIATELISKANKESGGEDGGYRFCDNFNGLYESYLLKKNALKAVLKRDARQEVLDRHKTSATLVSALVAVRLISDDRIDELDGAERYDIDKSHRLNEQLAFWCGITTLMMYMTTSDTELFDYSEGAQEKIKQELDTNGMTFPPSLTAESYEDSTIRGLFYSGIYFGENPIAIANSMYLVEQYFYKHLGVTVMKKNAGSEPAAP